MSEPDPPPENKRDRRHMLRLGPGGRRWLALIAALAVGAALGAVAVRKERDAAAAREARNRISLVAAVGSSSYAPAGPEDGFPVNIRIYNAGPKEVRVLGAALTVPGFRPGASQAATIDIESGEWSIVTPTLGKPDCTGIPAGSPTLAVVAVTAAGTTRTALVPVVDAGGGLSSIRTETCSGPPDIFRALQLSVHPPLSFAERSGRPVLRVHLDALVQILYPEDEVATIGGEEVTSGLLRARPAGTYHVSLTSPNTVTGTVELSIASCRRPLMDYAESDLGIPIRVQTDALRTTMAAAADAPVYVAVAELYHRTCD